MKNRGQSPTIRLLMAALVLSQATACVRREGVVPPPASSAVQAGITVEPPPPSAVLRKNPPGPEGTRGAPAVNPESLGSQGAQGLEAERLAGINDYLSETCSVRPVTLRGFDHFLNFLGGVASLAALSGATVGVVKTRLHK